MSFESPGIQVAKLPLFGHGVKASGQHVEVVRAVIPGAGIALGSPSSLEVDSSQILTSRPSEDVLALDG